MGDVPPEGSRLRVDGLLVRVNESEVYISPSKNGLLHIGQTSAGFRDFLGIRSSSVTRIRPHDHLLQSPAEGSMISLLLSWNHRALIRLSSDLPYNHCLGSTYRPNNYPVHPGLLWAASPRPPSSSLSTMVVECSHLHHPASSSQKHRQVF